VKSELDVVLLLKRSPGLSADEIASELGICKMSAERWLRKLHVTRAKRKAKGRFGRGNPAWVYSLSLPEEKAKAVGRD